MEYSYKILHNDLTGKIPVKNINNFLFLCAEMSYDFGVVVGYKY